MTNYSVQKWSLIKGVLKSLQNSIYLWNFEWQKLLTVKASLGAFLNFQNLTSRWLVLWEQVVARCLVHIAWPAWWLDKWLISPICCGEIWTISGNCANYLICISSGNSLIFFLFQDWNQKFKFPHASTMQDWLWYSTGKFCFCLTSHSKNFSIAPSIDRYQDHRER